MEYQDVLDELPHEGQVQLLSELSLDRTRDFVEDEAPTPERAVEIQARAGDGDPQAWHSWEEVQHAVFSPEALVAVERLSR